MTIGYITSELTTDSGWGHYSRAFIRARVPSIKAKVLISRSGKNDGTVADVKQVLPPIALDPITHLKTAWQIYRHLKGCDVIHCLIDIYGPGAALGSFLLGVPFVHTISGTYSVIPRGRDWKSTIKRIMMKLMYRRAARVVTGSERNIKLIQEVMPLPQWQFVPFGVTLEEFPSKHYPPPEHPFMLTVGAVKPRKGADVAVEALALLRNRLPDLHYKIVGNIAERRGYVEELRHLIAEKELGDRVEITGKVSDEELLKLYHQCAVFVLAAQTRDGSFEGFPGVFYEAHACGAPVVSTYGFGSEYAIKNGHNGFLVQPEDVQGLADAIATIVEDPALREKMSKNAREEAKKHTWDKIAEQYFKIYEEVLAARHV